MGEDLVDGGELGEWRVELAIGDLFAADFDVFEEGLVEEAAFGCVGLEVGGLDVVGELEGVVEGGGDGLLVDLVEVEEVLGGGALAADAGLLVGVDVFADRVGVVGGEEFAFLVVEPGEFCLGAGGFFGGDLGDAVDVGCDGGPDAAALEVVELDGGVVAFDGGFDCLGAVVGLFADAGGAAAADEVVVEAAALAFGLGEEEAASAVGAAQCAAEVVVVSPAAFAGLALGVEDLLHLLEGGVVDEWLVASVVAAAGVVDDADVVVVAE